MKIRIPITETRFGYMDIEVPNDSPILKDDASVKAKRLAAKKLGENALLNPNIHQIWPDDENDSDEYIPTLNVSTGYIVLEE